jgi:nucleotide-binding universal stress UspA family protein
MMKVLIGYDGSWSAEAVLEDLRRAGLPREGEALVVSVGEVLALPEPSSAAGVVGAALTSRRLASGLARAQDRAAKALEEARILAAAAARRVRFFLPGWDVRAEPLAGTPAWELLGKAEEWGADLVVVGSQGRSALGRLLLGSVSKKVAEESSRSVRIARPAAVKGAGEPPRIIVGVDGSAEAERAVRAVGERVWPDGTRVLIVAVDDGTSPTRSARIQPPAAALVPGCNEESAVRASAMVEWGVAELRAIGLDATAAILEGDPRAVLVGEARRWDADCIFVGPRKFSGAIERLRLGSVSSAVGKNAHCSVEVVRGPEAPAMKFEL